MNTAIVRHSPICEDRQNGHRRLVEAFLSRRSEATRRAYESDLSDFAAWLEVGGPAEAVAELLSRGPGPANELGLAYKSALLARGLKSKTVNRRLAALRSVVKLARTVGACGFALEVEGERVEPYRDTRGPGLDKIRAMIGLLQHRADGGHKQAARDLGIVRLLFNLGLRRGEVVSLDLEHFDPEGSRLSIKGKARAERQWVTTPAGVIKALEAWIELRGDHPGPLFVQLDRLAKYRPGDGRLSSTAIWRMLRKFGIRPHGLRHAAVTEALRLTGGDIPEVMAFSRHRSASVVMLYDDRRKDRGGRVAAMMDAVA